MPETATMPISGETAATTRPKPRRAITTRLSDRSRLSTFVWPALALLVLLAGWELACRTGIVDPIIVPPPTEIATVSVELLGQPVFWDAAWVTVQEAVLGFAFGVGTALLLGTLIGFSQIFRLSVYPLAIAFQITPRIALAPLFLAWFGFGLTGKVVMAATLCFFPILISVVVGFDTVDRDAQRVLESYGASRWEQYRRLILPSSLPVIMAGVKTAVTFALIGAVVGEFVGGSEGMGVLLKELYFQLEVAQGFVVIFALALLGLAMYGVVELVERKLVFWRGH